MPTSSTSRLRVVHVFPNSARLSCGPCNAVISFMLSQVEAGLEVRAISPADAQIPPNRHQPIDHLPIREFDPEQEDLAGLIAHESRGAHTVFHFHGISRWSDGLAKHLVKQGIPYTFTSHGQLHYHGLVHGLKKLAYLNSVSPFIRDAAGLHFLTQREHKRSRFILPFWRKPVLIQPNLVELPDLAQVQPADRTRLNIPSDAFVFAYLGRLDVHHKGLDHLIAAFAKICGSREAHLLLIGPDFAGGENTLKHLAHQLGCDRRVHFPGPQLGLAKWEYLKMADAFVSPSRWEAFGIALAEGLGAGLPTVISNQMNVADELAGCGAALVCPLSAEAVAVALKKLMNDGAARAALSTAGRRWVIQACASANAGPRFREFYRQL